MLTKLLKLCVEYKSVMCLNDMKLPSVKNIKKIDRIMSIMS